MAIINIPGAFLHADSVKHVIVVLKRKFSILMYHVNPKLYRKYIIFDKRSKPVLYVKFLKALYRLLRSALLFYRKLVKNLREYGIKMNSYNPFF